MKKTFTNEIYLNKFCCSYSRSNFPSVGTYYLHTYIHASELWRSKENQNKTPILKQMSSIPRIYFYIQYVITTKLNLYVHKTKIIVYNVNKQK